MDVAATPSDHPLVRGLEAAAELLLDRLGRRPEIAAVLGSGLGALAEAVEDPVEVPFEDVAGLPPAGVAGHRGGWVGGELEGRTVLVQAGRFHLYEGHAAAVVVAPIRIAAAMGARTLLVTNSAGGVDPRLAPGSLMLIEDHLNLMGSNPLAGPLAPGEERFPDMTEAYDPELRRIALDTASELGLPLEQGVYAGVSGPSYETPAEIRMLAALGARAVGMSTVPEVIVARARGLRVLALSLITNPAAGIRPDPLSHREVLDAARRAAPRFERLVRGILRALPPASS